MTLARTQRVVFQPTTFRAMQRGVRQIVDAIRPTLGPLPRTVAIVQELPGRPPELFDEGAVIARRILQLPDRDEDMGAMLIRHMLWRVYEEAGDGTATAAVLFESVFDAGVRYVTAGGNAMLLRGHLEEGMRLVLDELSTIATPAKGRERLAQIGETICYDAPLAKMLGEVVDIVGEYGQLEIKSGRSRELEREYIEGMYWDNSGLLSRQMITDYGDLRTEMQDVAILISDLEIEEPKDLLSFLEMAHRAGIRNLAIIARKMSEAAVGLLLSASRQPDRLRAIGIKTPDYSTEAQREVMQDLAILTGGLPVVRAAGQKLTGVGLDSLGHARRLWADRHRFGIVGGRGDPRTLRQHIADLRTAYAAAQVRERREALQKRIGKLMGGAAVLHIGAATELELEARKKVAERTAKSLRAVLSDGVLPGGGVALLACLPALQQRLDCSTSPEERAAYRILLKAMEAPCRTIISNAGLDASDIMADIRLAGAGHGFDVRSRQIVDMVSAGILDIAAAQRAAVRGAISSAALALTVDVLVHHRRPEQATSP